MGRPKNRARGSAASIAEVNARLSEATAAGAAVELILVVKGCIRPVAGRHRGRWRVRTRDGHVVTFRPEFVVALTAGGAAQQSGPRPRGRPAGEEEPSTVGALLGEAK
jgi:hypothetical protein